MEEKNEIISSKADIETFHLNSKKDILQGIVNQENIQSEKGRLLRNQIKRLLTTEGRQAADIVLHSAVIDCIGRGMNTAEIAKELGISITYAKQLKEYANKKIKEKYAQSSGNDMLAEMMGANDVLKLINTNILKEELKSYVEIQNDPEKVMARANEMRDAGMTDYDVKMWFSSRLDGKLLSQVLKNLESIEKQKTKITETSKFFETSPVELKRDTKSSRDRAAEIRAQLEGRDRD